MVVYYEAMCHAEKLVHYLQCQDCSESDCVRSVFSEPLSHFFKKYEFDMAVYYVAMFHAEKLVHCLQCQGHSEGLHNQNLTVFTISSKLLVHLQPNCLIVQHHKPECSVEKNGITAFEVKVTVKVQNVSECLSGRDLLNHRIFCYQTWYGNTASLAKVSCRKIGSISSIQFKGHSKGLYNHNMTIFTISLKLLVRLQTNLV